jgi:hypothetical protein
VQDKLEQRWSPEQISVMLEREFPDDLGMRVSHEAIYQSIYVQGRGALRRELAACLRTGRALRKPRRKEGERRGKIPGMVMISERPAEVEDRAVPGHWEGDLIIGKDNKSAIGTLVERSTRFVLLLHLPDGYGPDRVAAAMTQAMGGLPDAIRRSLTWDQGKEMTGHAQIAVAADLDIYFCDPHSPWQRGTNEKHQRAAAAVLSQGNRPVGARQGRTGRGRRAAERPAAQDPGLADPGAGTGRGPGRRGGLNGQRWPAFGRRSSPDGCRAWYEAAPPASRLLRTACGGLRPALTPETSAAPGGRNPRARPRPAPDAHVTRHHRCPP